ncbi:hypothetical protein KIW84_011752 [Lathyrus oleraceus]|uniref:nucleoside-diphosphate kinase n=1 Tax=Pisum sativum TaxID=3888 RepID=A0A9D5BFT0_PEA|nr:hypothetical protein KIW84_011752 [Pisum sativum]
MVSERYHVYDEDEDSSPNSDFDINVDGEGDVEEKLQKMDVESVKQNFEISFSAIKHSAMVFIAQDSISSRLESPDDVQRGLVGEIISRFEKKGLKFVNVGRAFAKQHYADLSANHSFSSLVDYIIFGPVVAMIWEGKNVLTTGRKDALTPMDGDGDVSQDIPSLCQSIMNNFHQYFGELLAKLHESSTAGHIPSVTSFEHL